MSRASVPEPEYLPAVLEVERTPPPLSARCLIWATIALLATALTWAAVGRVDIVSVAPGIVVPAGRTKTIQPLENAVVTAIHVREGQRVASGQILIELDATAAMADRDRLDAERARSAGDRARLGALLEILASHAVGGSAGETKTAAASRVVGAGRDAPDPRRPALAVVQRQRLHEQQAEFEAILGTLDRQMDEKRAERLGAEARLRQFVVTLPLLGEEVEAHRRLLARGMVARVRWLALERERIAAQQELAAQRHRQTALGAALATIGRQRDSVVAQYRARWLGELADAEARFRSAEEELVKAERRVELQRLRAPVAGTVQQLSTHTVGGVVTAAQPLMLIVPDDAALEIEARVANKDIGFVREGQEAVIKVEAFDFTRYGVVDGRVRKLSRDAFATPTGERVYLAHVTLTARAVQVDGRRTPLAAGMAVTTEIRTGRRRLIEFLLSPLLRYRDESARER